MKSKMTWMAAATLGIVLGMGMVSDVRADESVFGYVYTTDVLPKGKWEYEQWQTLRAGKMNGTYRALDLRNEIEYGVTDNFQVAFYLNSSYVHSRHVYDMEGDPAYPYYRDQDRFDVDGVSVEFMYRFLSPYKDAFGFAAYLEPELEVRDNLTGENQIERALDFKLIFQKNFLEDRLILAAHTMLEPEWVRMAGINGDGESYYEHAKELYFEQAFGISYRFAPKWRAGVELRNHREFPDFHKQEHSAFFFGPNVHYGTEKWWATFAVMPQIKGNPTYMMMDEQGSHVEDTHRTLAQHEKIEIRLKVGYNF